MVMVSRLDPLYVALAYFRNHEFEACVDVCSAMLEENPYDEAVWSLKTRALTQQVNWLMLRHTLRTVTKLNSK
jgi:tetratricopeptide repeat protein 8